MRIATEDNLKETIIPEQKEAEVLHSKNTGNNRKNNTSKSESQLFMNKEPETSVHLKQTQVETRVVAGLVDTVRKLREKRLSQGKNRRKEFHENSISFENRTYLIPEVSDPSISENKDNTQGRSPVNDEHPVHIENDTVTIYKNPLPNVQNPVQLLEEQSYISAANKVYGTQGASFASEGSSIQPDNRTYIVQRTPFATIKSRENDVYEAQLDFGNQSPEDLQNFMTSTPIFSEQPDLNALTTSPVNTTYIVNDPFCIRSCHRNPPRENQEAKLLDFHANENMGTPKVPLEMRNITRRKIDEMQEHEKENQELNLTPVMSSKKKITVPVLTPRLEKLAQPKNHTPVKKTPTKEPGNTAAQPVRKWHCSRCKYIDTTKMTNAQFEEYMKTHNLKHGFCGRSSTPRK